MSDTTRSISPADAARAIDAAQTVYLPAHATNEWVDGPAWLEWQVTPAMVGHLQALAELAIDNNLSAVELEPGGISWMPASIVDELRLGMDTLVLRSGKCPYLWFRAYPKLVDGPCETSQINLSDLADAVAGGEQYLGGEPEGLKARMAECVEEEEDEAAA
jgi:hypothetical protein